MCLWGDLKFVKSKKKQKIVFSVLTGLRFGVGSFFKFSRLSETHMNFYLKKGIWGIGGKAI
jgi:hypothetical protein